MTCKDDCLHYEVCLTAFSSKGMYLGDDAEEMECFKNKADFVEVVRCNDCAIPHNKWTGCPKLNGLIPPPDFFCSYGERSDT